MIDSHTHVWTDDTGRYPRLPSAPAYAPARFSPEDFFLHAKPAGVRRAVLIQMSFYGFDNSYLLDSLRAYPGVFSGVAVIDATAPNSSATMIELASQGVRGFRIQPGRSPRTWLDTEGMHTLWTTGAKRQLAMCPLLNPDALASVDCMCARHPETPVVIDHLARIGADGEIRSTDVRLLCGLAKHQQVSVKLSAFYALGRQQPPYRDLVPLIRQVFDHFGPHRLLWASDAPFQVQGPHSYAASLAIIEEGLVFASGADKRWILEKTAESLFFAKPDL